MLCKEHFCSVTVPSGGEMAFGGTKLSLCISQEENTALEEYFYSEKAFLTYRTHYLIY